MPLGRASRLRRRARLIRHLHLDAGRHHRRRVWNVVLVAEHELQGVVARGQRYFGFGLAGAKVQMLEVVRYFRVERRRGRIDDQMMMTRIGVPRFITTTGQSAPLRRIGTFGLAVGAACAFSLGIAGQVLTASRRPRNSNGRRSVAPSSTIWRPTRRVGRDR
jgi:hypothetical protein